MLRSGSVRRNSLDGLDWRILKSESEIFGLVTPGLPAKLSGNGKNWGRTIFFSGA